METNSAFLGVVQSITGRRWVGPDATVERAAMRMAQVTGLPDLVARQLAANGIEAEQAESYLAPKLRDLMPDPSTVTAMDAAADRLVHAVRARQKIAVFGDYDVDGGASVALMSGWLQGLGLTATPYIPDRIDEGYGPNVPAMQALGRDHDLIVCVDCGTLSHEPIAAARAAGADVVIVDHHLPGPTLPDAIVVNPNRADDGSGLGHLCAAGVVFLLLVACNRALRAHDVTGPDLLAMLDLVAVATVADVAPMLGLNRAFVRQGLIVMSRRDRPGMVALADVAGLTAPPTAGDLGFTLGPRINAGGRIGAADLGARLLMTADDHEAHALAERLDVLNRERREIEAAVLDAAIEQIEARPTNGALVWAAGDGWHPGVVGIVASRLKDKFNRPAVVIGLSEAEGKGSGRSVPGIDLGAAVAALTAEGLLGKGGGHKMAAGLSVDPEKVAKAMDGLEAKLAQQGAAPLGPKDLRLLGAIAPAGATPDLVEQLEAAGPFGPANPAPRLGLVDVIPSGLRTVGDGHVQVRFSVAGQPQVSAIGFRAAESDIAKVLEAAANTRRPLHAAGRLEIDDWGGRRKAKLRLEDLAEPT
ncbi:MAG: single-stranded-DNA-specific exonuclease RecJ [Pseudomonadota bacterium]